MAIEHCLRSFNGIFLYLGIYCKNNTIAITYEISIRSLCYLVPDLTLEPVLEQSIAALETLTETHQLQVK